MILKQLDLAGFRGVRDQLNVPFGSGFTVFTGRNGSGKSTICDAIEFVLTGTLSRFSTADVESGEHIEDYIWCREATPQAERNVRATFILDDESQVSRWIGQSGKFQGAKDHAFYDPSLCPSDPLPRICQTSIIRDEMIAKFSTDMSEVDRFDFVHKAIGTTHLASFERRALYISEQTTALQHSAEREYAIARERVADVVAQLSEARVFASRSSGENIEAIRARMKILASVDADDTQSLTRAVETRVREARTNIADLERLKVVLANLERQRRELDRLQQESEGLSVKICSLEKELQLASAAFSAANERLRVAEATAPIDASLAQLKEHGARIGLQDGHCPLCGSTIAEHDFVAHLQQIEHELDQRSKTLAKIVEEQTKTSLIQAEKKRQFESASAQYARSVGDLETVKNEMTAAEATAKALLVTLDESAIEQATRQARELLSELERGLEVLEASAAVGRIADLEQTKIEVEERANELAARISRLSIASQNAKSAADVVKRVAWEIVDERLAALSPLLSEMYVRLQPHMAYSDVSYRMRGDVRRFLSFRVGNEINPRFTFSTGQRRALGLAFLLSVYLTRPWCHFETLVMDDPVQHIDDYRSLHLVEALSAIRQLGKQIVCTVEDPALADLLCRRLRSTTVGEGLLIELEYDAQRGIRIHKQRELSPLSRTMLISA